MEGMEHSMLTGLPGNVCWLVRGLRLLGWVASAGLVCCDKISYELV